MMRILYRVLVALLVMGSVSSSANAIRLALEPQNRFTLGYAMIDGGKGIQGSFESRLTQLVYINMGGFSTINSNIGNIESDDVQDWVKMHHSIWVAPGIRVPHRYNVDSWNWDIIARTGFACVFTNDANRDDLFLVDPAGLVGGDVYIHNGKLGLRYSGKMLMYAPEVTLTMQSVSVHRFVQGLELIWQW
jgi:hypothetical protein